MKRNIYLIIVSLLFASCRGGSESYRPISQGTPYELILVASQEMQESTSYDTLRVILSEEVEMINESEPIYDVVATLPANFRNVIQQHRNVLVMDIGDQYTTTEIDVEYDKYSKPQLYMRLTSPSNDSLANYIWEKQDEIITLLSTAERKRLVKAMEMKSSTIINDTIKNMFDISMNIPLGYTIRDRKDNFLWLSYELPQTSQGIFIYTYFYNEGMKFTQKNAISMRNSFASYIPGPRDSTYMITSEVYPPIISRTQIDSREWIVQRGFWDVQNDFMGGPFVSFSTLDVAKNRIVVIETYIYSPFGSKRKRNLLRHLEAIAYTAKFND